MRWRTLVILICVGMLSSCSLFNRGKKAEAERLEAIRTEVAALNDKLPPLTPTVFRAVGYGAPAASQSHISAAQRDLLAKRASTMDAYRSLAERVYGTRLSGSTSIQNLATSDDRLRSYLDATIMGAKVVAQNKLDHGVYETIVELVVDDGFRNCLANTLDARFNVGCGYDGVYGLERAYGDGGSHSLGLDARGLYFIE